MYPALCLIASHQLEAAFKSSGIPCDDAKLRRSMKLLDKNGDGVIDLDEFKAIVLHTTITK